MSGARKTLVDVIQGAHRGKRWTIRLECTEGKHNKFWEVSGAGVYAPVSVRWGRIGSRGQCVQKDFSYMREKLQEKFSKGYVYDVVYVEPDPEPEPPQEEAIAYAEPAEETKIEPQPEPAEEPKRPSLRELMRKRKRASTW